MTPFPRQRRRRVSVEELLSRTTDVVPGNAIRQRPGPPAHRTGDGRRTRNVRRLSVGAATVVTGVCLTAFAATSKPDTPEPVAAPALSLLPPSPQPSAGTTPVPTSAPDPATFSAPVAATPAPRSPRPVPPATSPPAPAPVPVRSCTVRFAVTDSWPGGFTASVGITNTGNAKLSPWTLTWTFTAGQQVTHGWDGEYSQSGSHVTVHPASYNPAIAAAATTDIGFNGSDSSANPAPTDFALNGTRCTASP